MAAFLYYLAKNTIVLSVGAGITILLQNTILKRSYFIVKALWMIVLLSAFCPLDIFDFKIKVDTNNARDIVEQTMESGSSSYGYISYILFAIWVIVAVSIFVYKLIKHKNVEKEFKELTHYKNRVYFCKDENVGLTCGFFRPKIIISECLTENQFLHVLNHESQHVKAKDNLIKLLWLIVCCVYWLSPLLWIGAKYLENVIERCCDIKAVEGYTKRDIKDYAMCLSGLADLNLDSLIWETAFAKKHSETYYRVTSLVLCEKRGFTELVIGKVLAVLVVAMLFVGVKFVYADNNMQDDGQGPFINHERVVDIDNWSEIDTGDDGYGNEVFNVE